MLRAEFAAQQQRDFSNDDSLKQLIHSRKYFSWKLSGLKKPELKTKVLPKTTKNSVLDEICLSFHFSTLTHFFSHVCLNFVSLILDYQLICLSFTSLFLSNLGSVLGSKNQKPVSIISAPVEFCARSARKKCTVAAKRLIVSLL